MICKQLYNWKLIVIGLVLVGLAGIIVYFKQSLFAKNQLTLAQVNLPTLVKEHPDWRKYLQLNTELKKLCQKWGVKNQSSAKKGEHVSASGLFPELQSQEGAIEEIYKEESQLKLENLNKSIQEYTQTKTRQVNQALNEEFRRINFRLNNDIQIKTQTNEAEFKAYCNELQNEYQLTLANLQLSLSLLDISPNSDQNKAEKEKLQTEIKQIQTEIALKKTVKKKTLDEKLKQWIEKRKEEAKQEFERFKTNQEQKLEAEILAYRKKLEKDFSDWQQRHKDELDSTKKLREAKWEDEYHRARVQETIIRSQQEQLKTAILWDICQKAKRIAREKKIDCIITGAVVNVNLQDLTDDLRSIILE